MDTSIVILFWIALLTLVMTWGGYPVFLVALSKIITMNFYKNDYYPSVTVLLTVHNEENIVERRLHNLLSLNYPEDSLEILVASDGSTDNTDAIVESISRTEARVKLLKNPGGGKSQAQNRAIPQAHGEIIVLTDADTVFDANILLKMMRNFADSRVGGVVGKCILKNNDGAIAQSQAFYWQYEVLLRKLESQLGCLHTGSGIALAIRKALFRPFENRYGDDCVIPLDILLQGYKVVHEDEAIAYDSFPASMKGELKARIRITLRNITGTLSRYPLLNPLKFPLISVAIFFHKICRWLTPYFLLLLACSNFLITKQGEFYLLVFYGQVAFYSLGLMGLIAEINKKHIPLASSIFTFILANLGFLLGVLKAICGCQAIYYKK